MQPALAPPPGVTMPAANASPALRRPALEATFQRLTALAATADLDGVTEPVRQWLAALRKTVPAYMDEGPPSGSGSVAITPVSADGVPAEWIMAEGASPSRRLVYIHGGGWAAGSPTSYRALTTMLARLSNSSLLVVDYRLAPEHLFPAGLDDCVRAYQWALVNGPDSPKTGRVDHDPAQRVSIAGDSAGGNLAAAACVRLATSGGRLPDRVALIAGTLDHVSMWDRVGVDDLICTPEALQRTVENYLLPSQSPADPEVSPVFAARDVLARFPPTLLQVSSIEALSFDSKRFAERLEGAGVRVALSLWPEVPHVWQGMFSQFPEAEEALHEIADFINR